jgi:hypothetical protein
MLSCCLADVAKLNPSTAYHALLRAPQTYGILIYKQLGAGAQEEFSKTWGVGYALNNVRPQTRVALRATKH